LAIVFQVVKELADDGWRQILDGHAINCMPFILASSLSGMGSKGLPCLWGVALPRDRVSWFG
jgi:hypothetical protein